MNNVIIFNSPFGDIRIISENCLDPLFVAKDVAAVLGYEDSINAIKKHCKGVVKYRLLKDSQNRKQSVRVIEKTDYYRLVFNSKSSSATKYQNLIFEEVLKKNCELVELVGYDVKGTKKINFTSKVEE